MVGTFGPTGGWLHILLWPIYGQFTNRWGEGWASNFEKYFFATLTLTIFSQKRIRQLALSHAGRGHKLSLPDTQNLSGVRVDWTTMRALPL